MSNHASEHKTGFNWDGPYFKGATKQHRALKREEAEIRNAKTPDHRRRAARRSSGSR